jgi:hypothetical protein
MAREGPWLEGGLDEGGADDHHGHAPEACDAVAPWKKNTSGHYQELLGKTGAGDQYYESAGPGFGATLKELFE